MTTLAQQVLDSAIKSPEISREILQNENGESDKGSENNKNNKVA